MLWDSVQVGLSLPAIAEGAHLSIEVDCLPSCSAHEQHLLVCRQWPKGIVNDQLEGVGGRADLAHQWQQASGAMVQMVMMLSLIHI